MLYKGIIVSFVTFLVTGISSASDFDSSSDNDNVRQPDREIVTEDQPPTKLSRSEKLSQTQRMALYFLHLLRRNNMRLDKTYLHKFIYFANGLNYSIFNKPLLENFSFEAHQYGPFVSDVQSHFETLINIPLEGDNMISNTDKSICDFTFNALNSFRAGQLSDFTHEPGTPWTETRNIFNGNYGRKPIRPELDQNYFRTPEIIRRFFLEPLLISPQTFNSFPNLVKPLLENFIIIALHKFKLALQENRFDDLRVLIEQLADLYQCTNQFSLNLEKIQEDKFISSLQTPIEGILSSQLFTEDFIKNGQLDLFYDPYFRTRVAIGAGLSNLTAIYYLQQIFETFSNNSEDYAAQKAKEIQSRLEDLSKKILDKGMTISNTWQDAYEQSLAHFYLANYDDAIIWMEDTLKYKELPERYRRDILHRAFYIKRDKSYIDSALENRFWDFYILKATKETQQKEIFLCFENAIMDFDFPEAYFKAGRMILRGNYTVPETSPLWNKMRISPVKDNAQVELGKALVEHSIKKGISEALTYYIESYLPESNIEAKINACNLNQDKPFAHYQKAKLLESQYQLQKARSAYIEAGELLGYQDAVRLSTLEEEKELMDKRTTYKKNMLESLYEDYKCNIQEAK